jgi:hypothetical protein
LFLVYFSNRVSSFSSGQPQTVILLPPPSSWDYMCAPRRQLPGSLSLVTCFTRSAPAARALTPREVRCSSHVIHEPCTLPLPNAREGNLEVNSNQQQSPAPMCKEPLRGSLTGGQGSAHRQQKIPCSSWVPAPPTISILGAGPLVPGGPHDLPHGTSAS